MMTKFNEVLSMNPNQLEDFLLNIGVRMDLSLNGCLFMSDRFFIGFDAYPQAAVWMAHNMDMIGEIQYGKNLDGFFVNIDPVGIENTVGLVNPKLKSGRYDLAETGGVLFFAALSFAELKEAVPHLFWCDYYRLHRVDIRDLEACEGSYDGIAKLFELREEDEEYADSLS